MTTELTSTLTQQQRLVAIDLMRGMVMIIMALDHTRDFFHVDAQLFSPTDLSKTTTLLFFTRWITHFCAPTFVFLSGISAGLMLQRKSTKQLSWFLFTRGLWLIILEATIIRFGFAFNLYYDVTFFEVIYTLGASMVVLSVLVYLPQKAVLILGLILIFGHDVLNLIRLTPSDSGYVIWTLLQQPGFVALDQTHGIFVSYPLIPWLGIMLAGYGTAMLYTTVSTKQRKRVLLYTGIAAIVMFIAIRFANVHGSIDSWSVQKNTWFTILSFINCTKYPVTLVFTLMILGPVLITLSFTEHVTGWLTQKISMFGRVPLFYFIVHFYILHVAALITHWIVSDTTLSTLNFHLSAGLGGVAPGVGYSLIWTYVAWIALLIVLYPLCNWYNRYKSKHTHAWLRYL